MFSPSVLYLKQRLGITKSSTNRHSSWYSRMLSSPWLFSLIHSQYDIMLCPITNTIFFCFFLSNWITWKYKQNLHCNHIFFSVSILAEKNMNKTNFFRKGLDKGGPSNHLIWSVTLKYLLWTLIRTASLRHFNLGPQHVFIKTRTATKSSSHNPSPTPPLKLSLIIVPFSGHTIHGW